MTTTFGVARANMSSKSAKTGIFQRSAAVVRRASSMSQPPTTVTSDMPARAGRCNVCPALPSPTTAMRNGEVISRVLGSSSSDAHSSSGRRRRSTGCRVDHPSVEGTNSLRSDRASISRHGRLAKYRRSEALALVQHGLDPGGERVDIVDGDKPADVPGDDLLRPAASRGDHRDPTRESLRCDERERLPPTRDDEHRALTHLVCDRARRAFTEEPNALVEAKRTDKRPVVAFVARIGPVERPADDYEGNGRARLSQNRQRAHQEIQSLYVAYRADEEQPIAIDGGSGGCQEKRLVIDDVGQHVDWYATGDDGFHVRSQRFADGGQARYSGQSTLDLAVHAWVALEPLTPHRVLRDHDRGAEVLTELRGDDAVGIDEVRVNDIELALSSQCERGSTNTRKREPSIER